MFGWGSFLGVVATTLKLWIDPTSSYPILRTIPLNCSFPATCLLFDAIFVTSVFSPDSDESDSDDDFDSSSEEEDDDEDGVEHLDLNICPPGCR